MSKKVFNMQGGKHSAAAYSELEKLAYGSCVASETSFVVSAGTGMNLNISTGAGLISDTIARRIGVDATETATVPTASASFGRIDTVVAYIDTAVSPTTAVTDNTNDILKFVVVAGTAASTPVAPTSGAIITAIGAGKPYMALYDVLVPQNATNTASMTLTDRRTIIALPITTTQRRSYQNDWLDLSSLATLTYNAYTSGTKSGVLNTSVDISSYIQAGDRVKFSQTTGGTKYAVVVAVSSTTITLYFGTDYSLANETITTPTFSKLKSPQGFPTNPLKWTLEYTNTTQVNMGVIVSSATITNFTNHLLAVGVGIWNLEFFAYGQITATSQSYLSQAIGLSTSNNSWSEAKLKALGVVQQPPSSQMDNYFHRKLEVAVASPVTYYLNSQSQQASTNQYVNGTIATTVIRAVCALL